MNCCGNPSCIGCLVVKRQPNAEQSREPLCHLCTDRWTKFRYKWIKSNSQRGVSRGLTKLQVEAADCDWSQEVQLQLRLEGISVLGVLGYSTPLGAVSDDYKSYWKIPLPLGERACTEVLLLFPCGMLKLELLTTEEMSVICFWTCGESRGNRSMTTWFAQVI